MVFCAFSYLNQSRYCFEINSSRYLGINKDVKMYRSERTRVDYDEYDRLLRRHKQEKLRDDRYENGRSQNYEPYYSLVLNGLNERVSHHVLKDGIFKEFQRFGSCTIKIVNTETCRIAFVNYIDPECAREAKYACKNLVLFETNVRVDPVYPKHNRSRSPNGYGRDYNQSKGYKYESRDNYAHSERDKHSQHSGNGANYGSNAVERDPNHKFPYHLHHVSPEDDPCSTRTLFVGNIDVNIREEDLRGIFDRYGTIEEIDIKRPPQPGKGNAYAFIKYFNVDMAHRAKCDMSGRYIGTYQCKIGYGKPTPTNCLWIGGLGPWVKSEELETEFDRFGVIERIEWPHGKGYAYVLFGSVDAATAACSEMRGVSLGGSGHRIRVDYAEENHMPSKSQRLSSDKKPSYGLAELESMRERELGNRKDSYSRHSGFDRNETNRSMRAESDRMSESRNRNSFGEDKSQRSDRENDEATRAKRMRTMSPSERSSVKGEKARISENDSKDVMRTEGKNIGLDTTGDICAVENMSELSKALPVVWGGTLVLKNSAFSTRMHLVTGNVQLVDNLMRDQTSTEMATLKITQRLRLDQSKLEEVGRRVTTSGEDGYAVLLAMGRPVEGSEETTAEPAIQQRPLRNLVSYLKQKEAAGVISLPPNPSKDKQNIGVLHAFPPCAFGYEYLTKRSPKLQKDITKDDHLVVVVVRGAV